MMVFSPFSPAIFSRAVRGESMKKNFVPVVLNVLCVLYLSGCPAPNPCVTGDEEACTPDASLPPDFCNSAQEALGDSANCHLVVNASGGQARKTDVYISTLPDGGRDTDWYFAQMPALTPRSLLHVNAGYSVPQTGVNFALSVLKQTANGMTTAVAAGINKPGTAAPKPVDLIVPFSESNAKLFVLANDEGLGSVVRVDNRNPYSVFVEVVENPDVNEPNDATPTAIPLTTMGAEQKGTQSGYLATNDDVDLYTFDVTASARQILYLKILGPAMHPTNPPPPYLMSYTLFDPADRPIAEGAVQNNFVAINLSTARLLAVSGKYKLKVQGFKDPASMDVVRGDLRIKYDIEVRIIPDLDTLEPNDAISSARVASLPPNGNLSLGGRLSYVADEEWFSIALPARGTPSTLRYRFGVSGAAGRFAPLTLSPNRQLRIVRKVTQGATLALQIKACNEDARVCPKGFDDNTNSGAALVESLCKLDPTPQCIFSQRTEQAQFQNLKNFVGAIPIEANKSDEFFLVIRDEGLGKSKYADDRDWTLDLQWRDDTDEATRQGGPTMQTLGGGPTVSNGQLTFGYGRILEPFDINSGDGVRAVDDYDAVPSDTDLFEYSFGGASGSLTWNLEWELNHVDGGTVPPGELALEFSVCDLGAGADGGLCAGERKRIFAYSSDTFSPWYEPRSASTAQQLFTRTAGVGSTTFQVKPVACQCFAAKRVAAQRFFLNVGAVNRIANDPILYRLKQSVVAYPTGYTSRDGGSLTCPVVPDAGCGFTETQ
jgi:hypothetical protein